MTNKPEPSSRDRLNNVLRRPGLPAAGDHARLMLEQQDRRDAMRRAREGAGMPEPWPDDYPDPPATIGERFGFVAGLIALLSLWWLLSAVLP